MSGALRVQLSAAVEGRVDEAVCRRLFDVVGCDVVAIHVKNGKAPLLAQLSNYVVAARYSPWMALVDLDQDTECAPAFVQRHAAMISPGLVFRVAVRQVEAWLLADRPAMARFLGVSEARVPLNPDAEANAKECVLRLAAASRKRHVRSGMPARPGSGRRVGPLYDSLLIEFASEHWSPTAAVANSDSLARCVRAIASISDRTEAY